MLLMATGVAYELLDKQVRYADRHQHTPARPAAATYYVEYHVEQVERQSIRHACTCSQWRLNPTTDVFAVA